MDINELEKSLSKTETQAKSTKKEQTTKKKSKHTKNDESTSSIKTESITDNDGEEIEQVVKSVSNEKSSSKREKKSKSKKKKQLSSYASDFEDATSVTYKKKEPTRSTQNAEIQVDPTDLLRNGHVLNSISCFNPSSILLASTAYLSNETTLRDLNQISGYSMINKAFNDLIKMNVVFINNFLITQRNLYEEQLKSIQPKEAQF